MKVFTLDEANNMLPVLKAVFSSIYEFNNALKGINKDIKMLYDIWGKDIENDSNVDNGFYLKLINDSTAITNQIKIIINYLDSIGCVIKDLHNGLVDFYFDKNGELVFLCWKYCEDAINYWHPIATGYTDRRPIKELVKFI